MATINRIGYGQLEPNHLSGQRTGQIYAQLPAHIKSETLTADSITQLENGQFVKYDYPNKEVNFTGNGEWMLVMNEIKNYEPRQTAKDFALLADNAVDGEIVPRVYKTNVGDIITTNTLEKAAISAKGTTTGTESYAVGNTLGITAAGFLAKSGTKTAMEWEVVDIYTTPDGQDALKLMRIK